MRQQQAQLDELGLAVCVVTFSTLPAARGYVEETAVDWPILIDTDRSLYRAYGMDSAPRWRVYGPRTWLAYARLVLRGRRLAAASGQDVTQRGGDVLIDPQGAVRLLHVGRDPADRPRVSALLDVVRRHTRH